MEKYNKPFKTAYELLKKYHTNFDRKAAAIEFEKANGDGLSSDLLKAVWNELERISEDDYIQLELIAKSKKDM